MSIGSGTLADFGRANLAALQPVLEFTAHATSTSGELLLFADKPVRAIIDNLGRWTVDLVPADSTSPRIYYTLKIRTLLDPDSPDGGFGYADFPDWKIYPPAGSWTLLGVLDTPLDAGWTWVIDGGPDPAGSKSGDFLFDSSTNLFYRL